MKVFIESGKASGEFTVKPYTYGVYKEFAALMGLPTAKQLFHKIEENKKIVAEKMKEYARAGKVKQVRPIEYDENGKVIDAGIEINEEMIELGAYNTSIETEIVNIELKDEQYKHIALILEEDSSAINWEDCEPKGAHDAVRFFIGKAVEKYQKQTN